MKYSEQQRAKISEDAKGKVIQSLDWCEDEDLGGYWVITFTDNCEMSVRMMAEIAG